jgi:hypothetical protein
VTIAATLEDLYHQGTVITGRDLAEAALEA